MIEIADTNKHFKTLGCIVFKRKYSTETFYIDFAFETMGGFDFADFYIRSDCIEILSFRMAKKLLQNFGHLITNLFITNAGTRDNDEQRILFEFIDSRCTDTLKQLKIIGSQHVKLFDRFTKPLKSVRVLHLDGIFTSLDSKQLKFNELFPALNELSLNSISIRNDSFVDQHLPHLLRLHYENAHVVSHSLTKSKIRRFIANNAQIVELKLTRSTHSLLQFVADELKQIENLILIKYFEQESDNFENCIEFDSVKKLSWMNSTFAMPRNIVFKNLIEFETDGGLQKYINRTKFIANSGSLKKLHLFGRFIDDTELMQVTEVNRNFTEFRGKLKFNVNSKTIVKFIENGNNLRKVCIEFSDDDHEMFNQIVQVLRETVPKCWRISSNHRNFEIRLRR